MPILTEQEQQDIIRYVDANKPLPEKYRFLLFEDKREVELVWNGKNNDICNIVLPFQTIEQVDEPRAEADKELNIQLNFFDVDNRGRQIKGWTNKLIWGDNKLILSSLKNGPIREEIEKQGGIKLIYIDPPFDVGADFSMDIEIGNNTFTKKPNILEEIAYRDTWGKGADSFIAMIYERLSLMKDLLSEDGSIYVHCDWRVNSYIRLVLDEIFGKDHFINEISWCTTGASNVTSNYPRKHDTLYFYAKGNKWTFNKDKIRIPYSEGSIDRANRNVIAKGGMDFDSIELNEGGKVPEDYWLDIQRATRYPGESLGYPTQKSIKLLERIISASSNAGDLVSDFFCGSGTTAAVAEKLSRKWIMADLGKFAIHTTRKRIIGVQRQMKSEGKDYRAFEILNLGKYERQHYIGVNQNLREEEKQKQLEYKEAAFIELILKAYRAEKVEGFNAFNGKKAGRLVSIGPVNMPVTRLFIDEIIHECRQKYITRVDVLGFEFEMGLFPNVLDEAKEKGIDIQPKYIPAEVFDKRAVEKNQVVFHDVSYIEATPLFKKNNVAVKLTDYSVFYTQDSIASAEETLNNKSEKIVVEKGQIVKIAKDANGIVKKEVLTKHWTDWVDYWAVDFNFESKKEIIREKDIVTGEITESWHGDYIFENEWQTFRTKKDRDLELTSVYHECKPGTYKVAVKVVDIFGNDTMTIIPVTIGGK